jgi:hypothetical protein
VKHLGVAIAIVTASSTALAGPACQLAPAVRQKYRTIEPQLRSRYLSVGYQQNGGTYSLLASNAWTYPVRLEVRFYDDETGKFVAELDPFVDAGKSIVLGSGPRKVRFRYGVCVSRCLCTHPPDRIAVIPPGRPSGAVAPQSAQPQEQQTRLQQQPLPPQPTRSAAEAPAAAPQNELPPAVVPNAVATAKFSVVGRCLTPGLETIIEKRGIAIMASAG